jgi:hypothetical protein
MLGVQNDLNERETENGEEIENERESVVGRLKMCPSTDYSEHDKRD